ncbi:hypothetical protein [Paenibacillus sp. GCM10012306]|uniref:hypothetical protein n=1 Tax=Paenibacillus sp. GCM10012306 TaxID=3317342 RepID=UPI0036073F65
MFHPWSLVIPLLILLPSLLFFKLEPRNMPSEKNKKLLYTVAEGVGRVGVIVVPLFFAIHLQETYEIISLVGMVLALLLYYFGWGRYFRNGREYKLLYSPMLGVPVPLAISPIVYFLCASVVLHSVYMLIFSVILAVGHIPSSLREWERSKVI